SRASMTAKAASSLVIGSSPTGAAVRFASPGFLGLAAHWRLDSPRESRPSRSGRPCQTAADRQGVSPRAASAGRATRAPGRCRRSTPGSVPCLTSKAARLGLCQFSPRPAGLSIQPATRKTGASLTAQIRYPGASPSGPRQGVGPATARASVMHIRDIFQQDRTTFSFEFCPPKTDQAAEELFATIAQLQELRPSFVSVTYGAGGSTRERTHDLVVRIQKETSLTAVAHLTSVCHTQDDLAAILDRYAASGIENILALGGDPPKNLADYDRSKDAFTYAAQLVRFIRSRTQVPDSRGFGIGVAGFPEGHPTTPNRLKELDYLKQKVDAGADYICTQLFFENRDFYDFRERCDLAGIQVPIISGIMPIPNKPGMVPIAHFA